MPRGEDAKRQSLLRLGDFDLYKKFVDILILFKRNFLISPLEGEKKFLSELHELRNFREGDNLKLSCRNSNSDLPKQLRSTPLNRKVAFTLAEVLVTLGIIGVFSAMTVPTLMQNYQRKSYVTQLHKVYNELSQSAVRYQTDRNAINLREAGLTTNTAVRNFQKTYFKVVKDCGSTGEGCFAKTYEKISGVTSGFSNYTACARGGNCMTIASGVAIASYVGDDNSTILFFIDINGQAGPNILGRDAFSLFMYPNWVIDDLALANVDDEDDITWSNANVPLTEEQREKNFNRACLGKSVTDAHGCFGKILNDNWEMNY